MCQVDYDIITVEADCNSKKATATAPLFATSPTLIIYNLHFPVITDFLERKLP